MPSWNGVGVSMVDLHPRLGRMYAERGCNDKINHVIATSLLEIEIANGNHNQPRDEVNDKAGNDWIVECQKWCGCTHRVCSVLESEESSLHDPREHIEEYRRAFLFCSEPFLQRGRVLWGQGEVVGNS